MIKCRSVTISYGGKPAVSDVSFTFNAGERLCVAGENGGGKSTLIKGILGLIKPSSGVIEVGFKRGGVGYLPQNAAQAKDFPASVKEIVLSGCLGQKKFPAFYSAADKKRADGFMELLDITRLQKENFGRLSGGQRQRVLLARALCAARELLVLDEPAAALDAASTDRLYALLTDINAQGTGIITVAHDERAKTFAGRVLRMPEGIIETAEAAKTAETAKAAKTAKAARG